MQDLNDKVTGDSLSAPQWDSVASELQNVVEGLGITLSGADLNQLGKAIAGYASGGLGFTDSGAADAYVLSAVGSKQAPTAYADGMVAMFRPDNANTGIACTVNLAGIGAASVKDRDGNDPVIGTFIAGRLALLIYDATNSWFEVVNLPQDRLVNETVVSGAAVTTVTVTGLSLAAHKSYIVECMFFNPTGTDTVISMYMNNDTTATNYYSQEVNVSGATVTAARNNTAKIADVFKSTYTALDGKLHLNSDSPIIFSKSNNNDDAAVQTNDITMQYTVSSADVTRLDFTSSIASGIDIGSTIRIYRGDI